MSCESGPTVTPSGYTYIHHKKNNGPKPQVGEEAEFNVDIRNGEEVLNSSRSQGKPAKFLIPSSEQQGRSISPIVEAIQLMSVGDSLTVMQSVDSFPRKPPGFEDAEFVSYDIVLTNIISKEEIERKQAEQIAKMEAAKARESDISATVQDLLGKYQAKQLGQELKTTPNGLEYYVIEAGQGAKVENGSLADVHYYGVTMEGKMFDNSFKRGTPYTVPVGRGQVIRGWDEGLQLFNEGTKAVLFIPSELGYGATGSPPAIGANEDLVFYVELAQVQ